MLGVGASRGSSSSSVSSDAHASALAMELVSILTDHPPLSRRLRAADAIPAVAACVKGPAVAADKGGSGGGGSAAGPLVQLALIVLTKFVRNRSSKRGE